MTIDSIQLTAFRIGNQSGLGILDLLVKPFQRLLKYPLLIEQLIKYTDPSHPDFVNLDGALVILQQKVDVINNQKVPPSSRSTSSSPPSTSPPSTSHPPPFHFHLFLYLTDTQADSDNLKRLLECNSLIDGLPKGDLPPQSKI